MTISQPMTTYSSTDVLWNRNPNCVVLAAIPSAASVQMAMNSVHPQSPRIAPSVNGVYVPAISR